MIEILAQVAAPDAAEATRMSFGTALAWATALLILAAGLAVVEFLVVSWGMLLVGAAISSLVAIALAFHAHPAAGWIFTVITPVLGVIAVRLGFRLMRRNAAAVLPTEITATAGAADSAAALGIAAGAVGELVTAAFPTGRARFAGPSGPTVLDVQVRGGVLARGDRVVVLAIDGPIIHVGPAPAAGPITASNTNPNGTSHA